MMTASSVSQLETIAKGLDIDYQILPAGPRKVSTRMARTYQVPQQKMYDELADLGAHQRFFPHLKSLVVINSAQLGGAIPDNQYVVVESLVEGGSRLGVKLFTLLPPTEIVGYLLTDPFPEGQHFKAMHNKEGVITWQFEWLGASSTRMTVESHFGTTEGTVFTHDLVDHIWINFFENLMVFFGEVPAERVRTKPIS